jgi:hypothetical protein
VHWQNEVNGRFTVSRAKNSDGQSFNWNNSLFVCLAITSISISIFIAFNRISIEIYRFEEHN